MKKRAILFYDWPAAFGDAMLAMDILRDYKRENPLAIVYALLNDQTYPHVAPFAFNEGIIDMAWPVCAHLAELQLFSAKLKSLIANLKFDDVFIIHNHGDWGIIEILSWPNFKTAKITLHPAVTVRPYSEIITQTHNTAVWHSSGITQGLTLNHAILPILNSLDKQKKSLGIFPCSSNNIQHISYKGLLKISEWLKQKFNIILLGVEVLGYGHDFYTKYASSVETLNVIDLIGYGPLKQFELLKHLEVVLVTSGAVVLPLLYPVPTILLNCGRQRLHGYERFFTSATETVNPLCEYYPCDDMKTNEQGFYLCRKTNTIEPLCLANGINMQGIEQALQKLVGE